MSTKSSARVGAGLMYGFDVEQLVGCISIDVGASFSGACGPVPSKLSFGEEVGRGVLTRRGCLGGGGSPTRYSSLGETDREELE